MTRLGGNRAGRTTELTGVVADGVVADGDASHGGAGDEARASTRDSLTVATWTAVSRVTGLVRVAVIAAVLGPTFLGNAYQFTNSVPNLVYYGLLGGALVSSLLVPGLVRHIASGDGNRATMLAGGLFGCATAAAAVAVPVLVVAVPFVLRSTNGADGAAARDQIGAATWLVVLLAPQIVCYAVIACSVAVMNAHRNFALASAAPTIENIGSLLVLGVVWAVWGSGREVTDVGGAEIAVLGVGTTAAVVVHALVQWLGARRSGVTLLPRAGWRDPEVRTIAARGGLAMAQAGLWSVQVIVALALANRLAGGVVAVLIATNFFFLPIALGATPIALSALPRLAAHFTAHREADFAAASLRAISLVVFVTVPAAVGYLVLAARLAHVITFGSSDNAAARGLVTNSLAALALGVIGTGVFTVATYVRYAREDARTSLRAMAVQSVVAVAVMLTSIAVHGAGALAVVTGGLAVGGLTGAALLVRQLGGAPGWYAALRRSGARTITGAAVMAPCVWLCDRTLDAHLPSRLGQLTVLAVCVAVGAAVYCLVQYMVRSEELSLLVRSVSA